MHHRIDRVRPDVVHVGHLNHLSTSLLREAALREVPIVFTLHDYWLMCPRGQFMQMFPEDPDNLWAACDGQEDRKCAERCYARYFSGAADEREVDVAYWTDWVARRMRHVREMAELVDLFIAPARYLHDRYRDGFGLPPRKLVYLDCGFARARLRDRRRTPGEPFTFGYIGTHIPAKGIHDLIRAFGRLTGEARLRIWGRPRGQDTEALQGIAAALSPGVAARIEWLPEYKNREIAAGGGGVPSSDTASSMSRVNTEIVTGSSPWPTCWTRLASATSERALGNRGVASPRSTRSARR